MAQLKDTTVNGKLTTTRNIIIPEGYPIRSNNENGDSYQLLEFINNNTVVGYSGYENKNGNTGIYGNDVVHYIASAGDTSFRPYYRAGDVIDFAVRASGYVTNVGKNVVFTIPITKPVIGNPKAIATSNNGFVLRQNGYTHGSDGASNPAVYAKPTSYSVESNYNSGFVVTAYFDVATNVENNSPIGIYWDGTITLS
jgi:hypothetical protein